MIFSDWPDNRITFQHLTRDSSAAWTFLECVEEKQRWSVPEVPICFTSDCPLCPCIQRPCATHYTPE